MFLLGLTGSIGMGKSTTASMFADEGCAVWDADAAVHRLYARGGKAVPPMSAAFPAAVIDGAVSRSALKDIISNTPDALRKIETIVHPLVAEDRAAFIARSDARIVVLDLPLLFETGADARVDAVACVFVSDAVQEARVMARKTMTQAQFLAIRDKQMPAVEKCARSDFVIETDTLEHASTQVHDIIIAITKRLDHA